MTTDNASLDFMFPFEVRVNNLKDSHVKLRGNKLSGSMRHSNLRSISVGGDRAGDLNLGFKAIERKSGNALFESRIEFNNNVLSPGIWHNFSLSFINAETFLKDGILLTIDFVVEEKYWFSERQAGSSTILVTSALPEPNALKISEQNKSIQPLATHVRGKDNNILRKNSNTFAAENLQLQDLNSTVVFDVSDLMQFWADNIRPTGIQRVQSEVVKESVEGEKASDGYKISIIFFYLPRLCWMELEKDKFLHLIKLAGRPYIDFKDWKKILESLTNTAVEYNPKNSDIIVNLGSSWWIPDYLRRVEILKKRYKIRYVPFIHDVIPLATPQYCDANLVGEFRTWFREACNLADHVIVNSDASAKDVFLWSEKLIGKSPAISVAKLNAAFPRGFSLPQTGILERLNLDDRPYVLCIGTLEVRKNHAMLFRVWERLLEFIPSAQMASLVVVGKEGWMFESAKTILDRSPNARRWIKTLHGLSDAELSELYEGCVFNVYPSFYEGWGLPVTEASSYGKLNVASFSSSIPEAASKGDILIDPRNEDEWFLTLKNLLTDYEFLRSAISKSQKDLKLRTWRDISDDIVGSAINSVYNSSISVPPKIRDGIIYDFSLSTLRSNYECSGSQYRSGTGWHHLEEWGAWSAPGATELRFSVDDDADRVLYLVIRSGPIQTQFNLSVNRQELLLRSVQTEEQIVLRINIPYSADGVVTLRINVLTHCDLSVVTNGQDSRKIGIGILKFSIMRADDFMGRINFIESLGMHIV